MNTDGESSTLYRSFDIYTTFQYKLPAITLWKEESKVANIIATLLVLNPDVYVDLSLTYLGYGVNPAIYHAGRLRRKRRSGQPGCGRFDEVFDSSGGYAALCGITQN